MRKLENHSLKNYNTFGIDVKAKHFFEIHSEDELMDIFERTEFANQSKFVLGCGSNVLFTKNYDGIIIKNGGTTE